MIKFFRKIRYDLMEKNETGKPAWLAGKYFKYAIGEIILVVVGILIALSINNWNEGRKKRKEEIEVLKEIKSALIYDLSSLFPMLKSRAISRKNLAIDLIKTISAGEKFHDSINFIFLAGGETFRPSYTAYKALESKGLDIITNDSIKYGVIQIYDSDYTDLKLSLEVNNFANLRDYNRPFLYEYFKLNEHEIYTPIEPKLLLDSEKFKIILFKIKTSSQATISQLSYLETNIQNIITQIHNEIQDK